MEMNMHELMKIFWIGEQEIFWIGEQETCFKCFFSQGIVLCMSNTTYSLNTGKNIMNMAYEAKAYCSAKYCSAYSW